MMNENCSQQSQGAGSGGSDAVPSGKRGEEPRFTEQETERLWQWLLQEGSLYTNRVNFYIAAQSLFFVAFASTGGSIVFQGACALTGILLSVIWLIMSQNQVAEIIRPIRNVLKKHHREYLYISQSRTQRLRTHNLLGLVLPLMMIALWLLVLGSELWLLLGKAAP